MPLQNRVTPFGDIVAIPQKGMFTGNRGIIHDPATRTLLKRRWATKAWLTCVCEFKGRRRDVMARRSWTELFFLDEAVALAAGHRPCFVCRRAAAEAFRNAWALGRAVKLPPAPGNGRSAAQRAARPRTQAVAWLAGSGRRIARRQRDCSSRRRLHSCPWPSVPVDRARL